MGNYLRLENFDKNFSELVEPPIYINDLANTTEEDRENIRELFMTRYTGDMISLLPRCKCGATKMEASNKKICPVCEGMVTSTIEDDIQSALWFRQPKGVERLLNPMVWRWLEARTICSGFSIMQWLTDRTYKPDVKSPDAVLKLFQEKGIERGYNNFVQSFNKVLEVIFESKQFRVKGEPDYLFIALSMYPESVFSNALPLPNKTVFIVEKTNTVTYLDDVTRDALDLIPLMISIDRDYHDQVSIVKENRTAKVLTKLATFYKNYFKFNLSGKPGQIRTHMYASRTIFSFRAVISSITGVHQHDDIIVPWGVGLTAFRPHLVNKLMAYGMDLNSSVGLLMAHIGKYHPLLDTFLKQIVQESKYGKIICILQRNPSLLKGSAQRVGISGFHTDPGNHTIAMPIGLCVAFNADFDGDELNVSLALDNKLADLWYPLAPSFNAFKLDVPYKVARYASICSPVIAALSDWLEDEEDDTF